MIIQFKNEWIQFIPSKTKWNWYTFTFIKFEIEREDWLGQFNIDFILLGFGLHFGICYKKTEELKEMLEGLTKEDE
jgi:hypothetical protein